MKESEIPPPADRKGLHLIVDGLERLGGRRDVLAYCKAVTALAAAAKASGLLDVAERLRTLGGELFDEAHEKKSR